MLVSQSASPADRVLPAAKPLVLTSNRPKIGVNQITTYHWNVAEELRAYQQTGFESIGLWRAKLAEFGEAATIGLLAESDLTVSSLSWAGGFTGYNGHALSEAMFDVEEAIALAAEMNAGCVVVATGPRAGHTRNHARRLVIDALVALSDDAGERGVRLALQPMHRCFANEWTFLNTIDQTMSLISDCDHSHLGLAFDVYHLWQEVNLFDKIQEVAQQTWLVQLSDAPQNRCGELDRCSLGTGEVPLPEIMAAFQKAGFDGA